MELVKPRTVEEAKQYIGRAFWKYFREVNNWYEGFVEDVATELEVEGQTECGLFFLVRYPADDDAEHLTWEQLASLIIKGEKKWGKGKTSSLHRPRQQHTAGDSAGNSSAMTGGLPADVAAVADRNTKRQRRSGGEPGQAGGNNAAAAAAAALFGHSAAAGAVAAAAAAAGGGGGGGVSGSDSQAPAGRPGFRSRAAASTKRARGNHQQHTGSHDQQQQLGGDSGSSGWRKRGRPNGLAQQRAAAAAAAAGGDDVIPDSDEEEEAEPRGDSDEGRPGNKARKQQQQQPQGRRRQQPRQHDQEVEDEAAEPDEAELQRQFDALANEQQQQEAAAAAAAYDPNLGVTVRKQGLAGHIKHVQVQNFMCHENFIMEFGTHVNIISGSNGSGKSAVLQAMQAALGAKAKDTGRGDNFRELVRTGCSEAKVRVTLWNTGADAYMHDKLGDWVTIERMLRTGSGGATYKVYSAAEKKVLDGFKAVQTLLDNLNVDASNPLAVLTQDTARNFLCGSIADKKKYDLFMKATMLQSIYDHLVKASAFTDQMKEGFQEVASDHEKRRQKMLELRDKLQKLAASTGLAQKRSMYEAAAAYGTLRDRLDMLEKLKQQLEVAAPQKKAEIEAKLAACEANLEMLTAAEAELTAAHQAQEEVNDKFASDMLALAETMRKARNEHSTKKRAAKKLADMADQLRGEIKTMMEAKQESSNDRQQEFEARMREHEAAMAAARQRHADLEAHAAAAHAQLDGVRGAIDAKQKEVNQLQGRQQGVQQTLSNMRDHLGQLQAANGQRLKLFGKHAQLRQIVDNNRGRFERLPIGPLGAHLTLSDGMWAVAAEEALGRQLDTWLVHSARDQEELRRLARRVPGLQLNQLTVLVGSFERPAYRNIRQLRAGWTNLRQCVAVEHPEYAHIIDNKLMDLAHYEVVVVDEDEDRCYGAASTNAAGEGVTRAVATSGKSHTRMRHGTVVAGNYSGRQPRLAASLQQLVEQTQEDIQRAQVEHAGLQQQLVQAHGELQQLKHQFQSLNTAHKQALGHKARAAHHVQHLQNQMPELPVDEAGGDDFVAEQMRTLQEQLADVQLKVDKAEAELQEAQLRYEQAKQLHDDRHAEIEGALTRVGTTLEELNAVTGKVAKYNKVLETLHARMQKLDGVVAKLHADVATVQGEVDQCTAVATNICPEERGWAALETARNEIEQETRSKLRSGLEKRVRSGGEKGVADNPEALDAHVDAMVAQLRNDLHTATGIKMFVKKHQELEKAINSAEAEAGGSTEELQHQLNRAELEYKRSERPFRNMRSVVQLTSEAVEARWEKFEKQFDMVQGHVSNKFSLYMHRRGHQGRVNVDREKGELRLLVKINTQGQSVEEKQKTRAVKDLKQLSGGERSFTTVAFILALGEWTESPFRAMDEFDVFMDAINRRIATQTLLEFAREKAELQFVLLTPQDLQAVEDAKKKLAEAKNGKPLPEGFVKVVQMRPARPGQAQNQAH